MDTEEAPQLDIFATWLITNNIASLMDVTRDPITRVISQHVWIKGMMNTLHWVGHQQFNRCVWNDLVDYFFEDVEDDDEGDETP